MTRVKTMQGTRPVFSWALVVFVLLVSAGFGINAYRSHHRDEVVRATAQTEALLRSVTVSGVTVDPSGTACDGVGDLCIESTRSPEAALSALAASLHRVGLDFGQVTCATRPEDLLPYDATCQTTASSHGAQLWAVAGRHSTPYWSSPVWAAVIVHDPNYVAPASPTVRKPTATELLPETWHFERLCPVHSTLPCHEVTFRVRGSAQAVATTAARQLEREGFGVGFRANGPCREIGGIERCTLLAQKYLTPYGNLVVVGVFVEQDGPNVVSGRVGVS